MSPIVYVPPRRHYCEPPGEGDRIRNYKEVFPEGTIWECDDCGSRWELEYDRQQVNQADGSVIRSYITQITWNRLDD